MTRRVRSILDSACRVLPLVALFALGACGQKGPLYLPTGEAAANRATLPQTLNPAPPASAATSSGTGTANPVPRP